MVVNFMRELDGAAMTYSSTGLSSLSSPDLVGGTMLTLQDPPAAKRTTSLQTSPSQIGAAAEEAKSFATNLTKRTLLFPCAQCKSQLSVEVSATSPPRKVCSRLLPYPPNPATFIDVACPTTIKHLTISACLYTNSLAIGFRSRHPARSAAQLWTSAFLLVLRSPRIRTLCPRRALQNSIPPVLRLSRILYRQMCEAP